MPTRKSGKVFQNVTGKCLRERPVMRSQRVYFGVRYISTKKSLERSGVLELFWHGSCMLEMLLSF